MKWGDSDDGDGSDDEMGWQSSPQSCRLKAQPSPWEELGSQECESPGRCGFEQD